MGLVILDLNGVLVETEHQGSKVQVTYLEGYEAFLETLLEKHHVAIWSSKTYKNVNRIVSRFPRHIRDRLLFIWSRSQCDVRGVMGRKDLRKVRESYPEFESVVLVDDTLEKIRMNPYPSTFLVQPEMTWKMILEGIEKRMSEL